MKKGELGQYRRLIRMLRELGKVKPPPALARKIKELLKDPPDPADWWKRTK